MSSSSSGPQVFVRVFFLRGLAAEVMRKYPRGKVFISCELGTEKMTTGLSSWGASIKANEVSWTGEQGMLKWSMSSAEMQNLKSIQPKLKLQIMVQEAGATAAETGPSPKAEVVGYILIDVRDLTREISAQSFKVHGMNGAELQVSAKVNTTLHAKAFPTSPTTSSSSSSFSSAAAATTSTDTAAAARGGGGEGGGRFHHVDEPATSMSMMAASTDSIRSVLRLALGGEEGGGGAAAGGGGGGGAMRGTVRFALSVALEDYNNLSSLCTQIVEEDKVSEARSTFPLPKRSFWLCWTLFDKLFQSEEFLFGQEGPRRVKDTIRVESPLVHLVKNIANASPLRIYLCSQERLIACADVPLPEVTASITDRDDVTLSHGGWSTFGPSSSTGSSSSSQISTPTLTADKPSVAAIKVGVQFTLESVDPGDDEGETYEQQQEAREGEQEDTYDDEFEEEGGGEGGSRSGSGGSGGRAVHFNLEGPSSSSNNTREDQRQQQHHQPEQEESEEQQHQERDAETDALSEQQLRHFRVNVEVRSIGGFKRPAHVSLTFAYPFLGSSAPVRTKPEWVLANSEVRVDGAAASYECCLSRENLRETLSAHPLKITALSRSNLGSTALGEVFLDMSATFAARPHSYRCPVTGRTYKTRQEYSRHRQTLCALKAAGRIPVAPPVDPVIIRATDGYLVFTNPVEQPAGSGAAAGAKVRVVCIVEDIGMVGPEAAMAVKPGYKMGGGGLYVQNDMDTLYLEERGGVGGDGTHMPHDPLSRPDLTPAERSRLEVLASDWENWRRTAEQQWREALREKENLMRKRLEAESAAALAGRADDLRRAHEEAGRLEVRLRATIDKADRQTAQLTIKEEQMQMRLAQKTAELQLLQRRVRDEAKVRVDAETRRAESLEAQVASLQDSLARTEKRAKDTEKDYETYRHQARTFPESVLREDVARLRAQLGETRAEVERERRIRSEAELEKEHFRSQMHRLALALKREREKSATLARQELEQLRLEFLAREERYILDGDRDELRTIRHELASLRAQTTGIPSPDFNQPPPPPFPSSSSSSSSSSFGGNKQQHQQQPTAAASRTNHLHDQLSVLLSTGLYDQNDEIVMELQQAIAESSSYSEEGVGESKGE